MYEEAVLPTPGDLRDGVVSLELREIAAAVPEKGWSPAYHFTIVRADSGEPAGLISLRVGTSESLRLYAGHVGYAVAEAHRGHRYATRALSLVAPVAWLNGVVPLWITCDPDNVASRRTCELAGAEYVDTVAVPSWHEMYARGRRLKCRYRLLPAGPAA
jgi:tagatose 1,6-diphosphate aldolase